MNKHVIFMVIFFAVAIGFFRNGASLLIDKNGIGGVASILIGVIFLYWGYGQYKKRKDK